MEEKLVLLKYSSWKDNHIYFVICGITLFWFLFYVRLYNYFKNGRKRESIGEINSSLYVTFLDKISGSKRSQFIYSWTILYKLYKLLKKVSKSLENFIKRYRCKWRNIKTANMVFKKVILQDFLKINELKNF